MILKWIVSISSLILVAGGVIFTDRNYLHHTISNSFNEEESRYDILISQWNESVIQAELDNHYLLPREDEIKTRDKLIELLDPYFEKSSKMECLERVELENISLEIPIHRYQEFVNKRETSQAISLDDNISEEAITKEIKRITSHRFVDSSMLLEIAYMNDFEIYFIKNLKSFYTLGLSRNVKKFDEYQKVYLSHYGCEKR